MASASVVFTPRLRNAKLEDVYDKCPAHAATIALGDFNAKVGRKRIFGPTVGL